MYFLTARGGFFCSFSHTDTHRGAALLNRLLQAPLLFDLTQTQAVACNISPLDSTFYFLVTKKIKSQIEAYIYFQFLA